MVKDTSTQKEPLLIGFMESFLPIEGTEIKHSFYDLKCRERFDVKVRVSLQKGSFGNPGENFWCYTVYTSRVEISHKLYGGGFGSHAHINEAETMLEAALKFIKENNLTLCRIVNNWPFFNAVVTNVNSKLIVNDL